jgi:hypothetical protein
VRQGLEVSLERETALNTGLADYGAMSPTELGQCCDIAVVVGGDGTMLGIARQLARFGLPLVGINQGRLGFITDVPIGQFAEALAPMIAGDYEEERRTMLEGSVCRDGDIIFEGFAMNDVVVSRGATASMVELKIDIGDEFVANLRADGMIIGSPTGSTAYALSAAGPSCTPAWPAGCWCRSRRTICRTAHRAARLARDQYRDRCGPRRQRQLRHAGAGQPSARRPHHRAALGAPGALPASARLELLRHLAPQAALEFGVSIRCFVDSPCATSSSSLRSRSTGATGLLGADGETGAGKSLLVDALQLALGSRGDAGVGARRRGALRDHGRVRQPPALAGWLGRRRLRAADTLFCAARSTPRARAAHGSTAAPPRSRSCAKRPTRWSTSRPARLAEPDPRRVGARPARCLRRCRPAPLAAAFARARSGGRCAAGGETKQADIDRERERLAWQIGEVDKLAPGTDEWDELNAEHSKLSHAQSLIEAARGALDAVNDADENAESLTSRAIDALQQVASSTRNWPRSSRCCKAPRPSCRTPPTRCRATCTTPSSKPERLQEPTSACRPG